MGMERRIEQKRKEMHVLADKYGLSDLRVLKKSKELDQLLNFYSLHHRVYESTESKKDR